MRVCGHCGTSLVGAYPLRKFCSNPCRFKARPIPPSRVGSCSGCGVPVQVGKKSAAAPRCQECRMPGHGTRSRYRYGCRCDECRTATTTALREWRASSGYRYEAQVRKGVRADVRQEVYERDGWICQICGTPTDREAAPTGDWFPSVDHVEPKSFSLIPDHGAENLRTAHRVCNSLRGANLLSDAEVQAIVERRRANAFAI